MMSVSVCFSAAGFSSGLQPNDWNLLPAMQQQLQLQKPHNGRGRKSEDHSYCVGYVVVLFDCRVLRLNTISFKCFFCRLFHLGVATADRLPSSHFTPSIVLCHINRSPPPLYPWIFSVVNGFSSFLPAYCLNRQQTLSNISPISPMHFYLNSLTSSPNCQI